MGSTIRHCTKILSVCSATILNIFVFYKLFGYAKQRKLTLLVDNGSQIMIPEMISEILSFMDVKDLMRYKSVCKKWKNMIEDRRFRPRTPRRYKYTSFTNSALFRNSPSWSVTLATCNGLDWRWVMYKPLYTSFLYFLVPPWKNSFHITNRAAHQFMLLPSSVFHPYTSLLHAFVHIAATDEYKLVIVSKADEKQKKVAKINKPNIGVLTLGGSDLKWRYYDYPKSQTSCSLAVSIGKLVHCVNFSEIQNKIWAFRIMSFDMERECFTCKLVPNDFIPYEVKPLVLDWDGSLSFVYMEEEKLHVSVLVEYKMTSKFVVPLTFLRDDEYKNVNFVPCRVQDGVLHMVSKVFDRIGYDLTSKRIQWFATENDGRIEHEGWEVPTVIRLKGMRNIYSDLF